MGLEWVGLVLGRTVGGDGSCTTLRARSVLPAGPPCTGPLECPPRANMATFDLILLNYSQNGQVSPKYVEKAYVSPYFQNRSQKSPLEILRIPFSSAFSHKELMGSF